MDRKLALARKIARDKGIKGTITVSDKAGKRFSISVSGRQIHFGLWPYRGRGTFIDHGDEQIRRAWKARHGAIKDKYGRFAYKLTSSPEFYSWHILW